MTYDKTQVSLPELKRYLQREYRANINKALAALTAEDREYWASKAAVAASELQHPMLVEVSTSSQ